ncbi:MAG: pilus assembly protein [Acidobacteria bacterium]|nr:pilus assembly protein [Acidobacteriota bacterium]
MRNFERRQKGGTLLEAAITLMLFFTLIFGVLEFGRAYNLYQTITNAAREGARYSVAPFPGTNNLPTIAQVDARVQQYLDSVGARSTSINTVQTTTVPDTPGTTDGMSVVYTTVNVQAPYTFLFFPFGSVTMRTSAQMRNETSQ